MGSAAAAGSQDRAHRDQEEGEGREGGGGHTGAGAGEFLDRVREGEAFRGGRVGGGLWLGFELGVGFGSVSMPKR